MGVLPMNNFTSVPELGDAFLQLFPHRYDFLYANHARPGESPEWHTESRYPLSDRMIHEGRRLYGVRFGGQTNYLLLDIDRGSPYHPTRDRQAVGRMVEALEHIGLTSYLAMTSSYSGGLHIYFPLPFEISSWELASAVVWFLQHKGFWLEGGMLEAFPNLQNYDTSEGQFSLFNAHRLPLQAGSYLLGDDWNLAHTSQGEFVRRWRWCAERNRPNLKAIQWAHSKVRQKRHRRLSFKASQFLKDLNSCVEPGWTDYGQTNWLLGRVTLRAYVFGHVLSGAKEPLTGDKLIAEIVKTATQLPGYEEYCRHKHEIWLRAEEWVRCAESSRYFPYASGRKKRVEPEPINWTNEWNQFQRKRAVERICFAIADAFNREEWPAGITQRFDYLASRGISGETLYKHADLWHPDYIGGFSTGDARLAKGLDSDRPLGASEPEKAGNLLSNQAVNPTQTKEQEPFWAAFVNDPGCNPLLEEGFSDLDSGGGDDSSA